MTTTTTPGWPDAEWDRARFDESVELARTQLAFPAPSRAEWRDELREQLLCEREQARDLGDTAAAEAADAHLEVLAAEQRLARQLTLDEPEPGE